MMDKIVVQTRKNNRAMSDITKNPPRAATKPYSAMYHGHRLDDPYAWLKDPDWQQVMKEPNRLDQTIRDYLEVENAYVEAVMTSEQELTEALFQEMKGRIKEDDSSVPVSDGKYQYYRRFAVGGQHPIFCRQLGGGGEERILIDGDCEAVGENFFRIVACKHSPNHAHVVYAVDTNGSEIYTLRIRDAETGKDLADKLTNAHGAVEWSDAVTLFYTVLDDNHRPHAVYRHRLGDMRSSDSLVYMEKDPGVFVGVAKTESRRYILIEAHDHQTSEVHVIDAESPDRPPSLIEAREQNREYSVSHRGDKFVIRTNADGAEDFKLVTAPTAAPGKANWCDWVQHRSGRLILGFIVFARHIARLEREDGLEQIIVTDMETDSEHEVVFDEVAYDLKLVAGDEFDTRTLRFSYSSPATPERVYDYDMVSRTREMRKEQEVPIGHDPDNYIVRRLMAKTSDSEGVPVTILSRTETPINGSAPLLLYGYGAYGYSVPSSFRTARLSLVDRGFHYAIAHVRGGQERGYRWYREGRREQKPNTFTDFIAAAECLIEKGFSRVGRIAAHGGSAGGLLMGAVVNMRPDLFGAVVADVPFVDTLNTMLDADLPLTPPEWPEWGNPIEDHVAFETIRAYSPYDNVAAEDYPPIFVTAGLTDPRVTYWEPAKWVARLRALKTDDNLLCLKTNMDAGHAGASGRFDNLNEVALAYAFILKVMNLSGSGEHEA